MPVNPQVRTRLEAQGFCGLDDTALQELAPWLRWSPALCALIMAVGLAMKSSTVLWALAGIAFLGSVLPFHPFDLLYNHAARYLTGTRPLPHHGPQRRFACALASAWLFATGWAFHIGSVMLGFIVGIPLVLVAALVSITHFCIPSFIYNTLLGKRMSAGG
jgi:hypothetical protein